MVDVTTDQASGAFDGRNQEGEVRNVTVTATVEATQALNDVIRFCRVPSTARVLAIRGNLGSSASAGAINVGVYNPGSDGTAVDADLFEAAQSVTSGFNDTNLADGAQNTPTKKGQPLWQAAGLTTDPGGYLVIAATVTTAFVASDTVFTLSVDYANAS